jgi:hypothetical protein
MAVLVVFFQFAISTAFEALDIAARYMTEAEMPPTPLTSVSVTGRTLHNLLYFSPFGM